MNEQKGAGMNEREEAAARAVYEAEPIFWHDSGKEISWDELQSGAFALRGRLLAKARAMLEAADAQLMDLIEDAESRHGSSRYCLVTTYELRKALGMNVDNWHDELKRATTLKGAGDE